MNTLELRLYAISVAADTFQPDEDLIAKADLIYAWLLKAVEEATQPSTSGNPRLS